MIAGLTLSNHAVVTAHTGTDHFVMIQWRYKRQPGIRRHTMACTAVVSRIWMITGFTLRDGIVMTTRTGTENVTMIHSAGLHGRPGCRARLVTGITGIGAVNVIA